MNVVRSWSLVSTFLLIKLIVNCMKGLLNSNTFSRSELMVSGEVDKSAFCVKKEYKVNRNFNKRTVKKNFIK